MEVIDCISNIGIKSPGDQKSFSGITSRLQDQNSKLPTLEYQKLNIESNPYYTF